MTIEEAKQAEEANVLAAKTLVTLAREAFQLNGQQQDLLLAYCEEHKQEGKNLAPRDWANLKRSREGRQIAARLFEIRMQAFLLRVELGWRQSDLPEELK